MCQLLWQLRQLLVPTLDILCCVLCCVYAYAKLCVCGGGGAHMPLHASSLLVFMSVCVMDPPPHFGDLLFVFYQFYLSRLERFVFQLGCF